MQGKVELPTMLTLPHLLKDLMYGSNDKSKHFIENIRSYNMNVLFYINGGKIDSSVKQGRAPPVFRLHGQNYHMIGSFFAA